MKDDKTEKSKEKQFREISVANPQTYEQCLKVTTPKTWGILLSVGILFLGIVIWGSFGHLEVTCNVVIQKMDGTSYALIPQEHLSEMMSEPFITIDGTNYELNKHTENPVVLSDSTSTYIKSKGNLQNGSIVYPSAIKNFECEDFATGTIVIERISPIQLLLDR